MIGAGKYDSACTLVRETTQAEGVILIVLSGNKGTGFSVQATLPTTLQLPTLLRYMANLIEADFKKGKL